MSSFLQLAGAILVSVVVVYALIASFNAMLRVTQSRKRFARELQILDARLDNERLRHQHRKDSTSAWEGYRKFIVETAQAEADGTRSITLSPHDRLKLPLFYPGQHLTFRFSLPGAASSLNRCYTVSERPNNRSYRITVKKQRANSQVLTQAQAQIQTEPNAVRPSSSDYVNDTLAVGDIVEVKAPKGDFFLDLSTNHPIVCIAGGIGITPFISMLRALESRESTREVWLFYGVRSAKDYAFAGYLEALAANMRSLHLHVSFSDPGASSTAPSEHVRYRQGHIDINFVTSQLMGNNFEFFVCGPPAMMQAMVPALVAWGVPKKMVRFEAFGPASVKGLSLAENEMNTASEEKVSYEVSFNKSGRKIEWQPESGTILQFAASHGIALNSGCCTGECLTCDVALLSGYVSYLKKPSEEPAPGSCLPCISIPTSNLKLDA